jgi:hypothetical protein
LAYLPHCCQTAFRNEHGSAGPGERFELRDCEPDGEGLVVLAYERQKPEPSLEFATGDGYPRYLAHIFNILVFQSMGGSSDHVYVFVFQKGKSALALKTAIKELIQVEQSSQRITVKVPPSTYPANGNFPPTPAPTKYKFMVETN